ncbi:MAG: tetratricopeptide repeat protein [Chitinophagaceae bacterium]|nr:tetratricopeptide repeat protein [Oligoflexus sp.]
MKWIFAWVAGLLAFTNVAEARSLMERLDHMIWGQGQELSQAYDAYDQGKFDDSQKAFQTYADHHQDAQEQNYDTGVAAYRAGKPDDAVKYWGRAEAGSDVLIKSRALANEAIVHIDKNELEKARDKLKDALAFDNDNKATQENLQWVEEQLKTKKNLDEKDKDQKNQQNDPKQNDQKQADKEKDKKDDKQAQQDKDKDKEQENKDKAGEKSQDKDQKQAKSDPKSGAQKDQKKSEDEKKAEEKEKEKEKAEAQAAAEKDKDKKEAQAAAEEKDKDKDKDRDNSKTKTHEGVQKAQTVLTPAELKNQEAERLLRSIDDKIGRYPLTDTEATGERGKDGKNW